MHVSILSALLLFLSACATAQDDSATNGAANDEHDVTIVDSTETTGIYVGGFEASILYPCSEPGEQWWMSMNPAFSERYRALKERGDEPGYRGPYVLARVEGDRTELGEYGHLGAYSREFKVTNLVDMMRLDGGPEGEFVDWIRRACDDGF